MSNQNAQKDIDFFDHLANIDAECLRIGWTLDGLKHYVLTKYNKKSRYMMTDSELWELYNYLSSLPSQNIVTATKSKLGLKKVGLNRWKK